MYFLTEILLCIRIVMQFCSCMLFGVLNVITSCPFNVRSWSMFSPPSTHVARSPRSFGGYVPMLFFMILVPLRMVATPVRSSSVAYWIFASRGASVGSGIVIVRFSQQSGSSLSVLSSSLSTGVSCCMIVFLDLGWVGGGGDELDVLTSG